MASTVKARAGSASARVQEAEEIAKGLVQGFASAEAAERRLALVRTDVELAMTRLEATLRQFAPAHPQPAAVDLSDGGDSTVYFKDVGRRVHDATDTLSELMVEVFEHTAKGRDGVKDGEMVELSPQGASSLNSSQQLSSFPSNGQLLSFANNGSPLRLDSSGRGMRKFSRDSSQSFHSQLFVPQRPPQCQQFVQTMVAWGSTIGTQTAEPYITPAPPQRAPPSQFTARPQSSALTSSECAHIVELQAQIATLRGTLSSAATDRDKARTLLTESLAAQIRGMEDLESARRDAITSTEGAERGVYLRHSDRIALNCDGGVRRRLMQVEDRCQELEGRNYSLLQRVSSSVQRSASASALTRSPSSRASQS